MKLNYHLLCSADCLTSTLKRTVVEIDPCSEHDDIKQNLIFKNIPIMFFSNCSGGGRRRKEERAGWLVLISAELIKTTVDNFFCSNIYRCKISTFNCRQ